MPSQGLIFNLAGPTHLTAVDWSNSCHKRSVSASLVQGVYVLERDRQENRQGIEALAPPWWEFFHFQLLKILKDDVDNSIFGAIYELNQEDFYHNNHSSQSAPRYVIALRGTITKKKSRCRDVKLDVKCLLNKLDKTSRFQIALQAVDDVVRSIGSAANVWLAGHSLGAAIGLLAGKNMIKMGVPIESYLFNPPFITLPLEHIKNMKLKSSIRIAGSIAKAGLSIAVKTLHGKPKHDEGFIALSDWIPYLFVNPSDSICSEYIGYFEHWKKMEEIGAEKIEKLATQNTTRSLLYGAIGKDSEPLHLLPSAYLTINQAVSPDFKQAHGIYQWWSTDVQPKSTLYQFKH